MVFRCALVCGDARLRSRLETSMDHRSLADRIGITSRLVLASTFAAIAACSSPAPASSDSSQNADPNATDTTSNNVNAANLGNENAAHGHEHDIAVNYKRGHLYGASSSGTSGLGSDTGGTPTPAPSDTGTPTPAPSDTTTPTDTTTPAATPPPSSPPATLAGSYHGVDLSGAEFGGALPGTYGVDYMFPNNGEVDYYMSKGLTTFRIPFMWERLQPQANGALESVYEGRLDALVNYITGKGGYVVLNPQNFARYYGQVIGSAAVPNSVFADFWSKVAAHYAGNPNVMFNLVNEPHDLPTEQWVAAANAAIAGIRGAGATNVIIAPGNNWTGAYSWDQNFYGTANSVAMLNIADPINNTLFEAHQYLDSNDSGGSGTCVSTTIGSERLKPWVDWLRANGKKGFLGEFGGGANATCQAAVADMLTYLKANSDVVLGWAWWGAGPWWPTDYIFGLDPQNGVDRPQMAWLTPFIN
jgi:endoglucanase